MKYTKNKRLEIGQRIYDGEITRYQAAEIYGIEESTARAYMRMYRDANNLPPKRAPRNISERLSKNGVDQQANMEDFESMTKEELILELVKAKIAEARLKKGYEVKGDGTVTLFGKENTK